MSRIISLILCAFLALPAVAALAQNADWEEVPVPEGVCSRGTPYSFYYREGSSDDLLIFFDGGGACWNGATCQFGADYSSGGPLFKDKVVFLSEEEHDGIFDLSNAANPLADHDMVFVPYCSADVHSGGTEMVYEVPESSLARRSYPVRIQHNGANNAAAVLEWTYANYADPSSVALMGCSAGSYGAIFHAYNVMGNYSDTTVTHLSDAGVGVVPLGWVGFSNWGFLENLPAELVAAGQMSYETFTLNDLYAQTAVTYPENSFAQYTTAADNVQIRFYAIMGGNPNEWPTGMSAKLSELSATVPNFDAYIAGGGEHCILNTSNFYTTETAGMNFRDWVAARLAGEATGDVTCDVDSGECAP